jgi:hypothetical protein
LPRVAALSVAMGFTLGHAFGAYTWLAFHFELGYWTIAVYFGAAGVVVASALEFARPSPVSRE